MRKKAIFLDRDGTICEDSGYISSPDDVKLLPGAVDGLKMLMQADYLLIIVTNQSGIARGYFTEKELKAVNQRVTDILDKGGIKIDKIYYCPHHPDENCRCRKPEPGMVLRAVTEFGLELKKCYIIGDSSRDIECGRRLGIRSVLISDKREDDQSNPDYIAGDLKEAAEWILKG